MDHPKRSVTAPLRKAFFLALFLCVQTPTRASTAEVSIPGSFLALSQFREFYEWHHAPAGERVLSSPVFRSAAPWNELLLSWNAAAPAGGRIEFEVQGVFSNRNTKFYSLGRWSEQTNVMARESVKGQKDEDGDVLTDLLRLSVPAEKFRLNVRMKPGTNGTLPSLFRLGISLLNTNNPVPVAREPNRKAWGLGLTLPETSQHAYPGGNVWCSPTSLSMVMRYWADRLKDPSLDQDVPQVVAGVYDPVWHGTGNWVFNTAHAGRNPKLAAYALRLRDLRDLEDYIAQDIPVVLSVSLGRLRGRAPFRDDGHLVVLTGFTPQGDAWIHDPDSPYPAIPGKSVRRLCTRENLERGWTASRRTVYLIQPAGNPPPSL